MGRDELIRELRELIIRDLAPLSEDELDNDMDLTDGVLDSLAFTTLFTHIETRIGRSLSREERTRRTVLSVNAIVDFIAERQPS